jgi:hypothetical protein
MATYIVSTVREDVALNVSFNGLAYRGPSLEHATACADAEDTYAVVTCTSHPGKILHSNGKPRGPATLEQIERYTATRLPPEDVAELKRQTNALNAWAFGKGRRR